MKLLLNAIKTGLLLLVVAYVGLLLLFYVFQRKLIYFPTSPTADFGLAAYTLDEGDVALQGYIEHPGRERVILYFGGNAEQIEYGLRQLAREFPTLAVAGFHYRGYSGADGSPSQQALFADALTIYDHLAGRYREVWVMGRSLGSGVAAYLAAQRPVTKLALVTPFDSIESIAREQFWYVPVGWLLKDPYRSVAYTPDIKALTLLLTAGEDRLVTAAHSERLFEAFADDRASYKTLPGKDHNNISDHPDYIATLRQFFNP